MELLTYPFYNPPPTLAGISDAPSASAAQDTAETVPSSHDTDGGDSGVPMQTELVDRPTLASDDTGDSVEGRPRSNSTSSSDSSVVIDEAERVKKANAAFAKLRTFDFSDADNLPTAWKTFAPPSIRKGDWRSYGPVQARVFVLRGSDWQKDADNQEKDKARSSKTPETVSEEGLKIEKREKKKVDKACRKLVSSACEGSIWITEKDLVFVLAEDTTTIRVEPEEHHKAGKSISTWIKNILKTPKSKKTADEASAQEGLPVPGKDSPLPEFVDGRPITGFRVPLSTITRIYTHPTYKDTSGTSLSRRSSRSQSLSRARSRDSHRSGSPALSRVASRKSTTADTGAASGLPSPGVSGAILFDDAIEAQDNDDSHKVLVQARSVPATMEYKDSDSTLYRIELDFLSSFFSTEAGDFAARLEKSTSGSLFKIKPAN